MHPVEHLTSEEALQAIRDTPATLEFRAMALDPKSAVCRSGAGMLLIDARAQMFGAVGDVAADDVERLYQQQAADYELLADRAAFEQLRGRFELERAIIQSLDGPWAARSPAIAELTIRPLEASDSIDHLPDELRSQISRERPVREIIAGFVDGVAVSFAYCASQTETWGDISIDTIELHRGRGIATAVVSELIDRIFAASREPVWGAVESNAASLALARKLGFTRFAGELFVYD